MTDLTYTLTAGLQEYLQNNLDDYLSAIKIEAGDGIDLPPIKRWILGWRDPFGLTSYPGCMIVPDRKSEAINDMLIQLTVSAVLVQTHSNIETLTKLQLRYADAVDNLVREKHRLGGLVDLCYVDNIDYYPASVSNQNIAVTDMRLTMSVDENRFC